MLITAAQFGKCFLSDLDGEVYVQMCRVLRILNAMRDRRIGIPLTYSELEHHGYKMLNAKSVSYMALILLGNRNCKVS